MSTAIRVHESSRDDGRVRLGWWVAKQAFHLSGRDAPTIEVPSDCSHLIAWIIMGHREDQGRRGVRLRSLPPILKDPRVAACHSYFPARVAAPPCLPGASFRIARRSSGNCSSLGRNSSSNIYGVSPAKHGGLHTCTSVGPNSGQLSTVSSGAQAMRVPSTGPVTSPPPGSLPAQTQVPRVTT